MTTIYLEQWVLTALADPKHPPIGGSLRAYVHAAPGDGRVAFVRADEAPAATGDHPGLLLQDCDRGLSKALADAPHARLHAAEAAEAIALPMIPGYVMACLHAYGNAREDDDGEAHQHLRNAIKELRRWAGSLAKPTAIPPGFWLAPDEPSEVMHAAAVKTIQRCTGNADFPPRVYRAMRAAHLAQKDMG